MGYNLNLEVSSPRLGIVAVYRCMLLIRLVKYWALVPPMLLRLLLIADIVDYDMHEPFCIHYVLVTWEE